MTEKFIDGRIVNLEKERTENLKIYAEKVAKNESKLRNDLDELITQMINK